MNQAAQVKNFATCQPFSYNSQLFTVLGNGITSRIFPIPVKYIIILSNPNPKPACLAVPYFLRSR